METRNTGGTFQSKQQRRFHTTKPDLVIWDKANKFCSVIELSCPADINLAQKVNDKINVYGILIRNLQILHPQYKFDMIPIIVGALGYIPKCLTSYLQDLGLIKMNRMFILWKCKILLPAVPRKFAKHFWGLNDLTW